jgi:hypothetical protein
MRKAISLGSSMSAVVAAAIAPASAADIYRGKAGGSKKAKLTFLSQPGPVPMPT